MNDAAGRWTGTPGWGASDSLRAPIAFLDVDHTLIDGSLTGYFIHEALSRRLFSPLPFLVWPFSIAAYRLGFFDASLLDREFPFLVGIRKAELEDCSRASFGSRVRRKLRPGSLPLVGSLRKSGFRVVLATSAIDILVAPLAAYLGIDETLASSLLFEDGRSLGRFDGGFAFGDAKLKSAAAYAATEGIPLEECAFYSDSIHDLPLLEAVGHPVAVRPDARLRNRARKSGWPIENLR